MNLAQSAGSVLSIFAAMLLASCGGGGSGGGDSSPNAAANSAVMGLWTITEFSKTSSTPDCEPPLDPFTTSLAFVSQSGNNLTVMFGFDPTDATQGADGGVFTGTITSGAVSLTGSRPVGSGNGTETLNLTATVAASCNAWTGSATFTFRQTTPSALSCTGTTRFSGTRTVGSGCTGTITNTPVAEDVAPHATVQTAQPVGLGSVITGSVPASDFIADETGALANADFYTFNITATTPVTAMLTSLQDSDLYILDSAGTVVAASATNATDEAVAIVLFSVGTYYVVVQPYSVTTTTGYTLVIQ